MHNRRIPLLCAALTVIGAYAVALTFSPPTRSNAQTQVDATSQQQTLDALVSGFFTQTAQANTIPLTATLAALFNNAQTATASARNVGTTTTTSAPTGSSFNIDGLEVLAVQELDLSAGPLNRAAYIAPDGTRFAYYDGQTLCIYSIAGEKGVCSENLRDKKLSVEPDTFRWSPDGKKLALSEDFFRLFRDSDIWLMDTESGAITDLTPAPNRGLRIVGGDKTLEFTIDVAPQFSADSAEVYFLRYVFKETVGNTAPQLFKTSVQPGTTPATLVANLNSSAISTYGFALSPDNTHIVYNNDGRTGTAGGTWFANLDGTAPKLILPLGDNKALVPYVYSFSADGKYVLGHLFDNQLGSGRPETSPMQVIPVVGGAAIRLDTADYVRYAGWSPTGSALLYVTAFDPRLPDTEGVYVSAGPGKAATQILPGRYILPTPRQNAPIFWARNGIFLLAKAPDFKLQVIQLGRK